MAAGCRIGEVVKLAAASPSPDPARCEPAVSCPALQAQMIAEVRELSELFMWKGEVRKGLADWDDAEKEHLGEELSNLLLYLIRLSDICGVDLGDAATRKIVANAVKYPAPASKERNEGA